MRYNTCTPPNVRPLRISNESRSTTSLQATNNGGAYEIAGRTVAIPSTSTTQQSAPGSPCDQHQLDWDKLCDPTRLSLFQNSQARKLRSTLPGNTDQHWSLIRNTLYSAVLVSYGRTHHVVTLSIFAESLSFFDATQFIPPDNKDDEARLVTSHELHASLCRDQEIWSRSASSEIEYVVFMENPKDVSSHPRHR